MSWLKDFTITPADDPSIVEARRAADEAAARAAADRHRNTRGAATLGINAAGPAPTPYRDRTQERMEALERGAAEGRAQASDALAKLKGYAELEMPEDWRSMLASAIAFAERHGEAAALAGWPIVELYGCDPGIAGATPPRLLGLAFRCPTDAGVTILPGDITHQRRPQPGSSRGSPLLDQPRVRIERAKDNALAGLVPIWTVTPPRPKPIDPATITYDVGALGTCRWVARNTLVFERSGHAPVRVEGLDFANLLRCIIADPFAPTAPPPAPPTSPESERPPAPKPVPPRSMTPFAKR